MTRPSEKQQEKENMPNCGLCCPSRPHSEIERKRKERYLDLARELKKLWNMKVTVIPIIIGAFSIV